jgi:hypothetical protein
VTHPSGRPIGDGTRQCDTCAWAELAGGVRRCLAAAPPDGPGPVLPAGIAACVDWEAPVRCEDCGACCREAFDAVPIEDGDVTAEAHPELLRLSPDGWRHVARVPSPTGCGTRCAALRGDGTSAPFRCFIYEDRPTACRDLEPGSWNCRFARTRVGLSPR